MSNISSALEAITIQFILGAFSRLANLRILCMQGQWNLSRTYLVLDAYDQITDEVIELLIPETYVSWWLNSPTDKKDENMDACINDAIVKANIPDEDQEIVEYNAVDDIMLKNSCHPDWWYDF